MRRIDVLAVTVDTASGSPVVLLGEQDAPRRVLPIAVGGPEAIAIALALGAAPMPPRPLSHDLLAAVVEMLDAHVDHAEVTGMRNGTFLGELAVDGPGGRVRLDSRPSDAIALALRVGAPLFASDAVLDEAGTTVSSVPDEVIEHDVARFRAFLDHADPIDFGTAANQDEPPDEPPDEPGP